MTRQKSARPDHESRHPRFGGPITSRPISYAYCVDLGKNNRDVAHGAKPAPRPPAPHSCEKRTDSLASENDRAVLQHTSAARRYLAGSAGVMIHACFARTWHARRYYELVPVSKTIDSPPDQSRWVAAGGMASDSGRIEPSAERRSAARLFLGVDHRARGQGAGSFRGSPGPPIWPVLTEERILRRISTSQDVTPAVATRELHGGHHSLWKPR